VGTVIVAAVAIIFLPDLLDGDKKKYDAEFENIPQSPKVELSSPVKTFPIDKLKNIELKADVVVEEAQDKVLQFTSNNNDIKEDVTTPILSTDIVKVNALVKPERLGEEVKSTSSSDNTKKLPEKINAKKSWVIQLGSFRHKKNVSELIEKLKYHGYTTFTRPITTKNGILTKVFVGPDINKSSLENKIKPLKQLTHVEGKVTRFYPTK